MTVNYEMEERHDAPHEYGCDNLNCAGAIEAGSDYFVDLAMQRRYCTPCGQRLRYHRKKWVERGEKMPLTFSEIDKRFDVLSKKGAKDV